MGSSASLPQDQVHSSRVALATADLSILQPGRRLNRNASEAPIGSSTYPYKGDAVAADPTSQL